MILSEIDDISGADISKKYEKIMLKKKIQGWTGMINKEYLILGQSYKKGKNESV